MYVKQNRIEQPLLYMICSISVRCLFDIVSRSVNTHLIISVFVKWLTATKWKQEVFFIQYIPCLLWCVVYCGVLFTVVCCLLWCVVYCGVLFTVVCCLLWCVVYCVVLFTVVCCLL